MNQQYIEQELIAITKQLLKESGETHQREIKLDASLQSHLGIDSIYRAELFQRIEKKFSVSIPDRLLAEAETLNDIAAYLSSAKPGVKTYSAKKIIIHHEETHVDPSRAKTLIDVLMLHGEQTPNKTHIYFQNEDGSEETLTYRQLLTASLKVAQGLLDKGLQEGETVAIMQPTQLGFFYTFFGTLIAGGIPVPIYPPFRMHMLETYAKTESHILNNAEVRILVTFAQAQNLSRLLQGFVPSLRAVTTVEELMQASPTKKIFHAKEDNFAFIQYTSGSTADPKGVLLTHFNLITNIRAYGKAIKVTPKDVAVSWLPLYHDMGLIGMWLGSLYFGVPLILLTPFTFLNHPERWLWAIHYHRGTLSGAPNFAYELCNRKIDPAQIEGLDLSSWRMAANGAEKVYPRTLELFANKFSAYGFKRSALLPVYGLAESTVALTIPPVDREFRIDYVARKEFEENRYAKPSNEKHSLTFVSCGFPIENHQVRIVDEDNHELPERYVGNLQFCGPSSMQGYYNNPAATEKIYHDGWFDTGDLAYQADGEIFITGRFKDLIIKAGRNIYPAEIEELVGSLNGIRQGCVTAFATSNTQHVTEQLIIVAETREVDKTKRRAIINNIKDVIATNLDIVPDHVELVAPHVVPKTSSGKLQRAACKKMYLEGRLSKTLLPPWLQVSKLFMQWLLNKIINAGKFLGKLIYTTYMALIILLTFIPVYIMVHFSSREFTAKLCQKWAKLLLFLSFCPLNIIGQNKLMQKSPLIFTANHSSYLDSIILLAFLPTNTRFVGKKELFSVPILRTLLPKLDYLAVDRFDLPKGIEDTKHIEAKLHAGDSVMIFPEGTFGYSSGLRPFRLGAFKMACETQTTVCPIALKGTRSILRNDEKLLTPGKITITISDGIAPQGKEWQDVTQLRNAVRAEIAKHCGEPLLDFIAAQTVAQKPPNIE